MKCMAWPISVRARTGENIHWGGRIVHYGSRCCRFAEVCMKSIRVLYSMFFFIRRCQREGITVGTNEGVWVTTVVWKAAPESRSPRLRDPVCQPDGDFWPGVHDRPALPQDLCMYIILGRKSSLFIRFAFLVKTTANKAAWLLLKGGFRPGLV